MDISLSKITQTANLKKEEQQTYLYAVILMGLFTFLFLGAEYLFVDVLSRMVSEDKTVLTQNYALGASTAGFMLYPLFSGFCRNRLYTLCFIVTGLMSILSIAFLCSGAVYPAIFPAGLVLFLLLGFFGSSVFYASVCMMKTDNYLARTVGISYALGILLQFVSNNLFHSKMTEAVLLSLCLLLLVGLLIKCHPASCKPDEIQEPASGEEHKKNGKGTAICILLLLLVMLMTCIFSTLDNAVTLVHSGGGMDIGQWPRILLALSGMAAGFIFDIKKRKYMGIVMYCVMVLSTLCIAVLKFAGPFLVGLLVFYLSAGFFAVFFTASFMEISRHMKVPELWAGMGRAVNNITAAIIAHPVLALLSSDRSLAAIVIVLVLFVTVSIIAVVYTFQKKAFLEQSVKAATETMSKKEKLYRFSEVFSFTERETEVLACLVDTEDNIQTIAENLHLSRRTLERHLSSIYEKTGVKSRIGLLNLYNK